MENASLEESDRQETSFDVPPEHIIQSSREKDWNGIDVAEIVHPLDDFALSALPRQRKNMMKMSKNRGDIFLLSRL